MSEATVGSAPGGETTGSPQLHLFQGYGVELEYMIVDAGSLAVRPFADRLLVDDHGTVQSEVEHGTISWSNELVSHVLELKTAQPVPSLAGLDENFAAGVAAANARLEPLACSLLGTGAHPFFDPHTETVIWPGECTEVYRTYDRIFSVRGHGWSNLQSVHLNLPFTGDEEFGRLHAAIRLVLPIIPALAASTPYLDGRRTEHLDARLHVYRHNQDRIPAMVGSVIPEAVFTEAAYEARIFDPILAALAPHDPTQVLKKYFANSRAAIARFDRGSIEIRLIDLQECPTADLAVAALIVDVTRALVEERWCTYTEQQSWNKRRLATILDGCIADGEAALIDDGRYAAVFGLDSDVARNPRRGTGARDFHRRAPGGPPTAGTVWAHLYDQVGHSLPSRYARVIEQILEQGTLGRRLVAALGAAPGTAPGRMELRDVYAELAGCLAANRLFDPGSASR